MNETVCSKKGKRDWLYAKHILWAFLCRCSIALQYKRKLKKKKTKQNRDIFRCLSSGGLEMQKELDPWVPPHYRFLFGSTSRELYFNPWNYSASCQSCVLQHLLFYLNFFDLQGRFTVLNYEKGENLKLKNT